MTHETPLEHDTTHEHEQKRIHESRLPMLLVLLDENKYPLLDEDSFMLSAA